MVNELGGIGSSVSAPRDIGLAGSAQPIAGRQRTEQVSPGERSNRTDVPDGVFSSLATAKDEAVQVAQTFRNVGNALEQISEVLDKLDHEVQQIKNYPPFPAGNERRQDYINSINGLRRQLEAMSVPPLEQGLEPVFYPKETGLFGLFPATATDEDVAAIGTAARKARAEVVQIWGDLHGKLAEKLPDQGLQVAGYDRAGVESLLSSIERQLATTSQPVMSGGSSASRL